MAALHYGADAVYLGMKDFSARADAGNFTLEELSMLMGAAHSMERRRKVYVAVNTLVREDETTRLAELLARLRSTQRRLTHLAAGNAEAVFKNGELVVDYAAGCAYLKEQPLKLTPIEYRLLCLLAQNVGKVLTHKYITQRVWGVGWENNIASLRVFMATLRKKLETSPDAPAYIQTHIGVGYRMLKMDE